ncbi:MAG: hypothetical protein ABS76_15670 [Pelagibacterium sp. SCN 64-44]|nr:MAG: hypothetical protein ABS76_15670 [Pelagibacterium sp. SCN 64-44]
MTKQEVANLLGNAEDAALNVDALLTLLEDAAWKIVNHTTIGGKVTEDDAALAASMHTAIMMARKEFAICYQGISEGHNLVSRQTREQEGVK